MGINNTLKVMVWGFYPLLFLGFLGVLTNASVCLHGKQYLNATLELCMNCTRCEKNHMVIRPCEVDRDTICIPVDEYFKKSSNPHRHRHNLVNHKHRERERDEITWRYGDDVKGTEQPPPTVQEPLEITSTEVAFSGAETLVWDWQAIALTSAVFACILFFLVITLYSFHQAKQWRRLKESFDADVEELSARLSLMAAAASTSEKDEVLSSVHVETNSPNKCVYLEQLLNGRKDTKTAAGRGGNGNLYIEGANGKT